MRYMKVEWRHSDPEEPIIIYCEIDENSWETRKVDVFRDGKLRRASATEESPSTSTFLSTEKLPSIATINEDAEFSAYDISHDEFEEVWTRASSE